MWETEVEVLPRARTRRLTIRRRDRPVTCAEAIELWRREPDFCQFFCQLLADAPFEAYFWEMPPISATTVGRAFEFVLVDAPALRRVRPDRRAFAAQFEAAIPGRDVVTFANLGGDADLVVPCPRAPDDFYPHIGAFSREVPQPQQHALWRAVGDAMSANLGRRPLWVSTSGLGVAWVHVRLDSRPKYYAHSAYRGT